MDSNSNSNSNQFTKPSESCFTIYSKSGCFNCAKVKDFLQENNIPFTIIDCDEYLLENKAEFLNACKTQRTRGILQFRYL